jgi:hypothetical protein
MKSLMRYLLASWLLVFLASEVLAQPYQPRVIWDRSGLTDSSAYGYKILPLGDQNDDGYADWAVYAQGNGHETQHSYLEFFHGGPDPTTQPYFTYHEDSTLYDPLWYGVEAIGDLNGDGYQDWMLKLRPRNHPPSFTYLFFYGRTANDSVPAWEWNVSSNLGLYALRDAFGDNHGDFNGDGYDDIYSYDINDVLRIYYGGNPTDTLPDWTLYRPPPGLIQSIPYAIGDFNGDGASDFMCFNMNNGNLAVFLGGTNPDTLPAYFWPNSLYPYAGIDSLNGDRADEWGGSYVHFGRPVLSPVPDVILNSNCASYAVDAGDFNGDGYHDLILYTWSTLTNPFGALDLHLGHPWLNPDPVLYMRLS